MVNQGTKYQWEQRKTVRTMNTHTETVGLPGTFRETAHTVIVNASNSDLAMLMTLLSYNSVHVSCSWIIK